MEVFFEKELTASLYKTKGAMGSVYNIIFRNFKYNIIRVARKL